MRDLGNLRLLRQYVIIQLTCIPYTEEHTPILTRQRANQISKLVQCAKDSAGQAIANVSFKRPDLAYVEYLVSLEILLNIIPHHQSYASLVDHREKGRLYSSLCKVSQFLSESSTILTIMFCCADLEYGR